MLSAYNIFVNLSIKEVPVTASGIRGYKTFFILDKSRSSEKVSDKTYNRFSISSISVYALSELMSKLNVKELVVLSKLKTIVGVKIKFIL